ncbi:hypothetical protein M231_07616 [Tremella mesenterica]|uniref:Uncharacterized protein n=1 Tax=Tremella mesenterica TaxID=5217 RepID=A0A4Q1BFP7_TREME|nr:uncharacterized protein TREMEDRAFT_65064 [Tremella mesenterica DSM 1558]EIW66673.1 hypothetical protein TREMEDRAFT_65064 [Tremella mesenterica DSM 1558]RXK35123.1 hypothetical protein M231_07616 [Tremella mesenterica]
MYLVCCIRLSPPQLPGNETLWLGPSKGSDHSGVERLPLGLISTQGSCQLKCVGALLPKSSNQASVERGEGLEEIGVVVGNVTPLPMQRIGSSPLVKTFFVAASMPGSGGVRPD